MRRAIRRALSRYKKGRYVEGQPRLTIWHPCGTVAISKDGIGPWEAKLTYINRKGERETFVPRFSLGSIEEWIEWAKEHLKPKQSLDVEIEIYECVLHKRIILRQKQNQTPTY